MKTRRRKEQTATLAVRAGRALRRAVALEDQGHAALGLAPNGADSLPEG